MPEAPHCKLHLHPRSIGPQFRGPERDPETTRIKAPGGAAAHDSNEAPGVRYAELHCVSNFSFLRGASHPEELVGQAAVLGYAAIAITDRNTLAGVVRAHVAAKEHGIHLIIGAEITPRDAPPIVLLVPDRDAYGRLCRLITCGRLRCRKGACELYLADVAAHAAGMIGIVCVEHEPAEDDEPQTGTPRELRSHGVAAEYRRRMSGGARVRSAPGEAALAGLRRYAEILPGRVYLGVNLDARTPDARRIAYFEQLAEQAGVPLVATNHALYHEPRRRYVQDVLTCIREKCTLATAGRRLQPNAERHLRTRAELARRYRGHAELLERTVALAAQCTFSLDELRYEYPHELVPEGKTAIEYLSELTWRGAEEVYAEREGRRDGGTKGRREQLPSARLCPSVPSSLHSSVPDSVRNLLKSELALIAELKYEHYFLTVRDLCRFARERGILCQGRGSAANSAVCYCLGITAVDPAQHDLLFERFISRERNEPPDIDVDFEHERREEVFSYIYEKYGRERAGITAEVITYRPRSAVRDVGKALGLSLDRVDAIAKAIDWFHHGDIPEQVLRHAGLDPHERTIRTLLWLVKQIAGFPRHLSQHVGGFVMTQGALCELVPLQNGAMPGRTFIEWDKDDIDALGLLKVDCLALGMLTAISKCFKLLVQQRDGGTEGRRDQVQQRCTSTSVYTPSQYGPASMGDAHGSNEHISQSACVAPRSRIGQSRLSGHADTARKRTLRIGTADAESGRVDPIEYRRGQCAPKSQRLSSFPWDRPRIAGGAGDPDYHCIRTQSLVGSGGAHGTVDRNGPPAARTDPESPTPFAVSRAAFPSVPPSLRPCVPSCLRSIPPADPRVYDMICAADTVGVFQIESRAQMSMLPRLKPRNFYDLVIEVAIVRPGPIQGGMVHPYLRRRAGLEPVSYPSPAVAGVLHKTLGVPLFQEQVMRLAVVAAGFTPGEADQLRRAMAAWKRSGQIEKFRIKLIEGLLRNGYAPEFAEALYRQIQGFGEYGFPESHAASFALLVYASAWLKCYYPEAFCAALLNSQPLGFYTPGQLIRDARRHGVDVLPADVNASDFDCTLETNGRNTAPSLRLGFRVIRGLSEAKIAGILAARERGYLTSIHELARAPGVSRETLARLAAADAFRSLGLDRRQALWQILMLSDRPAGLFDGRPPPEPPVELPAEEKAETLVKDYDATGFCLSAHPLELLRDDLSAAGVRPCAALRDARRGLKVRVAGLVTVRQRPGTAKGIVFMTLEDETGNANLIIRPEVWDRDWQVARTRLALIAEGTVERQGEVINVMVKRLLDLPRQPDALRHDSRDFH